MLPLITTQEDKYFLLAQREPRRRQIKSNQKYLLRNDIKATIDDRNS